MIEELPDGSVIKYLKNEVDNVTDMCVFEFDLERSFRCTVTIHTPGDSLPGWA